MVHTDIKVDIQGYDIDADVVKAARENAKRAGGRSSDPFSAKSSGGHASSEEIWLYYFKPAIWRAVRRKGKSAGTLPTDRRDISWAGCMVDVSDHEL